MPQPPDSGPSAELPLAGKHPKKDGLQDGLSRKPYAGLPQPYSPARTQQQPTKRVRVKQSAAQWDALIEPRSFKEQLSSSPRLTLSTLLVSLLVIVFWVLLGIYPLSLPVPLWGMATHNGMLPYIAQLPFALLLGAILGPQLTLLCLSGILLAGLFIPIFPSGHWLDLLLTSFQAPRWESLAYWLLMSLTTFWVSKKAEKYLATAPKTWPSLRLMLQFLALALVAVGLVHGITCGATLLVYGLPFVLATPPEDVFFSWSPILLQMLHRSVEPLGYDLLLTTVGLWAVRPFRALFWILLY